jgi:hypothetical protein
MTSVLYTSFMTKLNAARHRQALNWSRFWWIVYGAGTFFWAWVYNTHALSFPLKIAIALVSVAPAILGVGPLLELWREKDELEMRTSAEGIMFSFAGTAILTWTYGFLELYAGFPHVIMWFVWPVMAVLWGVGRALAARRYR